MTRSPRDRATVPHQASGLSVRTFVAEVLSGPQTGRRVVADGGSLTVGSSAGNDLVIEDPTVSRFHLELRRDDAGILLIDNGSLNGTEAGGVLVERGTVTAKTVLRCGRIRLRIDDAEPVTLETLDEDQLFGLHGRAGVMRRLMAQIKRSGSSDAPVLIQGETGVGKELIARALHEVSSRHDRPMEIVDCGTLVPNLIASELFGHERGAFTGADRARVGAFERADGGTLFLDEIGELPLSLQPALLGALERRSFRRVGGDKRIDVDVRVIAATHRDLRAHVNAEGFRSDLYYRLAVVRLLVPPLRARKQDIPLLVEHFLEEMGVEDGGEAIAPEILDAVENHNWPGNVRELRNFVEAAVALGEPPTLDSAAEGPVPDENAAAATEPTRAGPSLSLPYKDARAALLQDFEIRYVQDMLTRTNGNVSKAARLGAMNRSYLRQLIARHGISPREFE